MLRISVLIFATALAGALPFPLRAEPVPGAGHFFPEEAPEFTNARLLAFLAGTDR